MIMSIYGGELALSLFMGSFEFEIFCAFSLVCRFLCN
jgi:hypothetical protein